MTVLHYTLLFTLFGFVKEVFYAHIRSKIQ